MLTSRQQIKFKEELFGTVHICPSKAGIFDPDVLKEPFVKPDSVIYAFCKNCGLVYELDAPSAKILFGCAKLPFEIRPGEFLVLGSCQTCGLADYTVELKKLSIN